MPEWASLIAEADALTPVKAETFVKRWHSASNPVLLDCDDGQAYVVKGSQAGRMVVTDQVVGRIGSASGTPVPEIALVDVPADLIAAEPQMSHMTAGIAHGSRWIPNCSEREAFNHTALPENRERFARIALLYGWIVADDHQFVYANDEPRLVYSVDHGHFLPGSLNWTEATLAAAPPPSPDATVVGNCSLLDAELNGAKGGMRIADETIAGAVAAAPDAWGISTSEREALAEYLGSRRDIIWPPDGADGDGTEDGE